jgi:hypothetical protein
MEGSGSRRAMRPRQLASIVAIDHDKFRPGPRHLENFSLQREKFSLRLESSSLCRDGGLFPSPEFVFPGRKTLVMPRRGAEEGREFVDNERTGVKTGEERDDKGRWRVET